MGEAVSLPFQERDNVSAGSEWWKPAGGGGYLLTECRKEPWRGPEQRLGNLRSRPAWHRALDLWESHTASLHFSNHVRVTTPKNRAPYLSVHGVPVRIQVKYSVNTGKPCANWVVIYILVSQL